MADVSHFRYIPPTRGRGLDELTLKQREALVEYAEAHGRCWKAALRRDWAAGTAGPYLQQVRNTLGPMWLEEVRL